MSFRSCVTTASDPVKRNALKAEGVVPVIYALKGILGVTLQKLSKHIGRQLATPEEDLEAVLAAGVQGLAQSRGHRALLIHLDTRRGNHPDEALLDPQGPLLKGRSRNPGSHCEVSEIIFTDQLSDSRPPDAATPVPRGRRTNTVRIAELETGLLTVRQQLEERNQQHVQLTQRAEELEVANIQLRRALEETQRECGAMRNVVDGVLGALTMADLKCGQKCDAEVGPDAVPSEPEANISQMGGCIDLRPGGDVLTSQLKDDTRPEALGSLQGPAEAPQEDDNTRGTEAMVVDSDIPQENEDGDSVQSDLGIHSEPTCHGTLQAVSDSASTDASSRMTRETSGMEVEAVPESIPGSVDAPP
jgi:hypothetical protein